MADDLGDNWWEKDTEGSQSKKGQAPAAGKKENITSKKGLKRKSKDSVNEPHTKKHKVDPAKKPAGPTVTERSENLQSRSSQKSGKKSSKPKKKKVKKPPSVSAQEGKGKSQDQEKSSSTKQTKKKKERKRISELDEEELSKPGTAEDLRSLMAKQLKGSLSEEALEDCLPDSDADFLSANEDSLSPSAYLQAVLPTWRAAVKKSLFMNKQGSPCLLLITSSAIRAVELNRDIKGFVSEKCKVAKLFAKHMKLEEQKKFLLKTNCQVGIGTPARISHLVKQGALQLENLTAVVLDWNWRDQKLKRMSDIPEVRSELVKLFKDFLIETVHGSACKIGLL